MKNVLLVSTPYMGIYSDIKMCLETKGFSVDCITQKADPHDPFVRQNLHNRILYSKNKYLCKIEKFWANKLSEKQYNKQYDYLIVINGVFVHPILFATLRGMNPNIKCINYLVDSSRVYYFERNFSYYDSVYTFDRQDSIKLGIKLLPIYWIPGSEDKRKIEYDVFALGGFKYDRYCIFNKIKNRSDQLDLKSYVKIYLPSSDISSFHSLYLKIKYLFRLGITTLDKDIIIEEPLSTEDFRRMIQSSRIVVDTILNKQTGLTSRLMWAIGLGKKVITNNSDIINYPFYNSERYYILKNSNEEIPADFFLDEYIESSKERTQIESFRIDKWIDLLLGLD